MLILDKLHNVLKNRILSMGGIARRHVVDGYDVHSYEIVGYGNGPPIVLVHGLGASAHSFFPVLKGLQSTWSRIYIPDLPGHGFSQHGTPTDIRGQQRVFRAYLDQVVREPAVLVGNSMGGAIVLQTAVERPDMHGVAMLSPAGAPLTQEDVDGLNNLFSMTHRKKAVEFFDRLTHRRTPIGWLIASDLMETFQVPMVQSIVREASVTESFDESLVTALEMPVLFIWGKSERILRYEGVDYFRRILPPHAHIEVFEKCGHLPMIEQPKRTLALLNKLATASRRTASTPLSAAAH